MPLGLTAKQQQVCDLISTGLSNREIGEKMGISHRTVEDYRADIFKKLGVRNAVELTRKILGISE